MSNKEFDKWVAENIMGYETAGTHSCLGIWARIIRKDSRSNYFDWHPTESISDAFQIVEKMRVTHFKWFEMAHRPAGYICNFVGDPKYTEFAETAPLAICLAAKKAIEDILIEQKS